jgi:hypothetical protein
MGFLTSLKRTFNISGTEVAVVTEDDIYSQCDRVSGKVVVRGGEYEQSGESIKLELKEFWTETRSSTTTDGRTTYTTTTEFKVHQALTFADRFSIQARSEQSYPFEVQLPMNCRISREHGSDREGWVLAVTLQIPGARDPTEGVALEVQPAEELLAIVEACGSGMRFEEEMRWRRWQGGRAGTHFRLNPPAVLKSELDYMELHLLHSEDGGVTGSLVFDLQEHSLADYFKTIGGRDEVNKPIALSRDDIFLPDGETNVAAITRSIGRSLQEVLTERGAVDKAVDFRV